MIMIRLDPKSQVTEYKKVDEEVKQFVISD